MRKMGELEADIAHHWQQISPLHWRFFLRPGVHFHHGRELEMDDVIASLKRINTLPLYSHIADIVSPTPLDAGYPSHATGPLVTVTAGGKFRR